MHLENLAERNNESEKINEVLFKNDKGLYCDVKKRRYSHFTI